MPSAPHSYTYSDARVSRPVWTYQRYGGFPIYAPSPSPTYMSKVVCHRRPANTYQRYDGFPIYLPLTSPPKPGLAPSIPPEDTILPSPLPEDARRTPLTCAFSPPALEDTATRFIQHRSVRDESTPLSRLFPSEHTPSHQGRSVPLPPNASDSPPTSDIILTYPPRAAVPVRRADLDRLKDGRFLNDTLIEFGLKLWLCDLEASQPDLAKDVAILSPFFFTKLSANEIQKGYQAIRRWTSKYDLFQKKAARIFFFDSLGAKHSAAGEVLNAYLRLEAKHKKSITLTNTAKLLDVPVPIQSNGYDCGIHLLHCARLFMNDPKNYDELIQAHRSANGTCSRQVDWGAAEIRKLRKELAAKINTLSRNQRHEK
ncbi:hypothetical protein ONZ45_g15353 [Pleurotus djamor]|nr:hypothetical protein ONZ45_g15353 [Pleurotus djamor]